MGSIVVLSAATRVTDHQPGQAPGPGGGGRTGAGASGPRGAAADGGGSFSVHADADGAVAAADGAVAAAADEADGPRTVYKAPRGRAATAGPPARSAMQQFQRTAWWYLQERKSAEWYHQIRAPQGDGWVWVLGGGWVAPAAGALGAGPLQPVYPKPFPNNCFIRHHDKYFYNKKKALAYGRSKAKKSFVPPRENIVSATRKKRKHEVDE